MTVSLQFSIRKIDAIQLQVLLSMSHDDNSFSDILARWGLMKRPACLNTRSTAALVAGTDKTDIAS